MKYNRGYLYLGVSILAFSTMEVAGKFISYQLHPLQINFLRFLIGSLTLLPFTVNQIKKNNIKISQKDFINAVLLGILVVPVSMSLFQLSIYYTKASITAVLISCNAIFAAPLGYLLLKERLDRYIAISITLGFIGIIIIAYPNSKMTGDDFIGILLCLASSVTFTLFSVLGKTVISRIGGLTLNTIAFISGTIAMVPILLIAKLPLFDGIHQSNILYILYIGVIVTAIAYIYMFKGFALLPVNAGSLVFFGKPVLAGILSYFLLSETFSLSFIAGSSLILLGILFVVIRKKDTQASKTIEM